MIRKVCISILLIGFFILSSYSVVADNNSSTSDQPNSSQSPSNQSSSFQSTTDQSNSNQSSSDQNDLNHYGISNTKENADKRDVQVEFDQSNNQLHIQSQGNYNGSQNNIQIEMTAKEGLKVEYQFSGQTQNDSNGELSIQLEARKIIEFIDNKTAGQLSGFDGNDTVENIFDMRTFNWNLTISNTTINSTTTWFVNATAAFNNNALIKFMFIFSNGYSLIDNSSLIQPSSLKYSVEIQNYSYVNANSQLALQMNFKSDLQSNKISHETEDYKNGYTNKPESGVNFGNGSATGYFSWTDNYSVDGVSKPIITSTSVTVDNEDQSQNTLYFSFTNGKDIFWDPKVAVTQSTFSAVAANELITNSINSSQTTGVPGLESITVVFGMVILAFSLRKRKNK